MIRQALLLNPLTSLPKGYTKYFLEYFLKRKIRKHVSEYKYILGMHGYVYDESNIEIELRDRTFYVVLYEDGRILKKPVCVLCLAK